jgi:hypothetical protein
MTIIQLPCILTIKLFEKLLLLLLFPRMESSCLKIMTRMVLLLVPMDTMVIPQLTLMHMTIEF